MTAQATLLYQLQLIDLNLAKRRNRLKEITTLLGDSHTVTEAQAKFAGLEAALRTQQGQAKNLDLEMRSIAAKIKETNDRLYSGKVRNPKELQEMQDEIASLQKRQSTLEDSLIEAMMRVDTAQAAADSADAELKTVKATDAGSKVDLQGERERLTGEVKQLEEKRKLAVGTIKPEALKQYESMRVAKRGQPIAPLVGESCKLCGVEQTTSIVSKVHSGHDLIFCMSCGRILAMVQG